MRFKIFLILFFVSFLINDFASAQETTVKKDSTLLYKKIESYSHRSKFTSMMYRMIFNPISTISKKSTSVKKKVPKNLVQKPYSTFEGKIIRNIDIVTLDPFGYSATDTASAKQNIFYKTGNKIHVKTNRLAILNLLLFRKNKPFNSLTVKESERLIRSQKYVHDVSFFVALAGTSKNSDSVDIFIRELDAWSLIPNGSISNSGISIDLNDKNIMGTGDDFQSAFSQNGSNGINSYKTSYFIPNIRNTYINSKLRYESDGYKNYNRGFTIERPFFSPLAKWAAGVTFTSQFNIDSLRHLNLVYAPSHFKFRTQDYWAGKAVQILKGISEDDWYTNLILAARYLHVRYFEKPSVFYDPFHIYSSEDFYMGSIGISTRKYVQDKYIFKFGITEDVPVGAIYGLTGGYQVKNNAGRFYLGIRYSLGSYLYWGYMSSNFEFGTFLNNSHAEQGVFTGSVNYFTSLFQIGKWKFRQFVKPQMMIGIKQFYYNNLTLNDGYGLDGFNSPVLSGSNRFLFTLQTQSYAPWNFIGFRFGPFLAYSIGMLGDEGTRFKNSKVYSQVGVGVLIKNANLVFNTFQLSISFYPLIPGLGQNIFKTNSFKTTDFGYRDFEFGKPAMVVYQ